MDLRGKSILLLYSRFFGYDKIVRDALQSLGASVDLYDARAEVSPFEKAVRKIDDSYYFRKQRKFHEKVRRTNSRKNYDYVFCNDILDTSILENYKNTFSRAKYLLFLDDSIKNLKGIEKTFSLYDRVLTFDDDDSKKYDLIFRPLFFCDIFQKMKELETIAKYKLSFIGTCHSDRIKIIGSISKLFLPDDVYFYCYLQSWFMYYYHYLREPEYRQFGRGFYKYEQLSMTQVAEIMKQSVAILDIQHPMQSGLTMRTIETIGIGRKLITTNQKIVEYDFYDPQNILIIDRNNPIIDTDFLSSEYRKIPDQLYHKYSINGWIEEVFKVDC